MGRVYSRNFYERILSWMNESEADAWLMHASFPTNTIESTIQALYRVPSDLNCPLNSLDTSTNHQRAFPPPRQEWNGEVSKTMKRNDMWRGFIYFDAAIPISSATSTQSATDWKRRCKDQYIRGVSYSTIRSCVCRVVLL